MTPSISDSLLLRLSAAMMCAVVGSSAMAAPKEAPEANTLEAQKNRLEQTQNALEASKQKHQQIKSNLNKLEQDLSSITSETQSIAANLQEIEGKLSDLEEQLEALQVTKKEKEFALKKRGGELSGMVGAMIRLGRAPQEAVIVMPGGVSGKIRASRALGMMSDSLQKEMHIITQQMDELHALEQDIAARQLMLKKENIRLLERRESLSLAMKQQQSLLEQLHSEDLEQQQQIVNLSRKSKDLKTLVTTLEKEREKQRLARLAAKEAEAKRLTAEAKEQEKLAKSTSSPPKDRKKNRQDLSTDTRDDAALSRGAVNLPAAGHVTGRYGQKRGSNNTLKGIELTTREGAIVTSPSSGEILFTGPFLDYGKMVIIRHNKRHHTLLAGFERVQCRAGQRVNKGEPVGIMGNSGKSRRLYMELRDNGKPVDPLPWLSKGATLTRQ